MRARSLVARSLVAGWVLAAGAVAIGVLVAGAAPAAAHGVGGTQPTNYAVEVGEIVPSVDGVVVDTVDLGRKLRVRNGTDAELVILGYEGEPYLRLDEDGVFENRRSPATFLNQSIDNTDPVPSSADARAEPEWHRISGGDTATLHWHSAHYMGTEDPPGVQDDPDRRQVVQTWTLDLRVGDEPVVVSGEVVWVPPPSPWPWIAAAVGIAVLVLLLSRTRWWASVLAGALVVLLVAETVHVIGLWGATTDSAATKLFASVYSIGGIAIGVVALYLVTRRDPYAATPALLLAGVVLAIAGGFADITALTRSQLPSTLPDALARLEVVLALGLGTGIAAGAALRLKVPTTSPPAAPVQSSS